MCGFTGIIQFSDSPSDQSRFMKWALSDLKRRGPDEQTTWTNPEGSVHFGFARLAIRDLTETGKQPMTSDNGNFTLMYNGETYNTEELIQWAGIRQAELRGTSDTEVLLKCFERKGITETVEKADGIFALALYSAIENKLYLARDRAGVKPLYYGHHKNGIVFSSHYHHVTSHPFFRNNKINEDGLEGYLRYGFVQEGEGLTNETYFAKHGYITCFDLKSQTIIDNPYFTYKKKSGVSQEESLAQAVSEAVSSQLVSDVPIGTFLSGGVDSGIVSAAAKAAKDSIVAFTIGLDDVLHNETDEAKHTAQQLHIKHKIKTIKGEDILSAITDYEDAMAEPLADFSSLLTLAVCKNASEELTVALSGDGGDELWWGYPRFMIAHAYYPFLNTPKPIRLLSIAAARAMGKPIPFRLMKFKTFNRFYLASQGINGHTNWVPQVLYAYKNNIPPILRNIFSVTEVTEPMQMAREIEYNIHMQRVLIKVDRASMYHSLEVRTPLLGKKIIEQSLNYRYEECVSGRSGKLPLKKLFKKLTGIETSEQKKGFTFDLSNSLRNELKEQIGGQLLNTPDILKPLMNQKAIEKLWNDHQNKVTDNSWAIWSIYSLNVWVAKKMTAYQHPAMFQCDIK